MMKWSYGMPMRFFQFCLLLSIRFKNQKSKKKVKTRPPQAESMHRKRRGVCSRSSTARKHRKKQARASSMTVSLARRITAQRHCQKQCRHRQWQHRLLSAPSLTMRFPFRAPNGRLRTSRFPPIFPLPADHPTSRWSAVSQNVCRVFISSHLTLRNVVSK